MTKAEQARIVAWRSRILRWAEGEPRKVAWTCRHFGISRTAYDRWKKRFEELGDLSDDTRRGLAAQRRACTDWAGSEPIREI